MLMPTVHYLRVILCEYVTHIDCEHNAVYSEMKAIEMAADVSERNKPTKFCLEYLKVPVEC